MELKRSVVKGVAWSTVEKVCSALLQLAVSLVLLSLLSPDDYGIIAIVTAIIGILMPLVDSGFSQALIRKKEIDKADYSSVFYLNMAVALGLYAILVALSPFISEYYDSPVLLEVIPVLALLMPINALSIIQNTIFSRDINFKRLSIYTLTGSVVSSAVAIWMALSGYGVWSLVAQRLIMIVTKTVLLWVFSTWRPSLAFSWNSIKGMFSYGSRILLSDIITNVYYQISSLFIGKVYSVQDLGYYDRGNKIKELPVTSMIISVMNVSFSALSRMQEEVERMYNAARKIFIVWVFVMFPMMLGIITVAEDMFRFLLPEIWLPSVPYLQILCVAGLFSPLSVVSYVLVKVKSDGTLIFRIELIKKAVATLILLGTIPISIKAIAWGQVAIFLSDMLVNAITARHFVPSWTIWSKIKDALPYMLLTAVMSGVILLIGCLAASWSAGWILLAKVVAGLVVYIGLAQLFKLTAWQEIKEILKGYYRKRLSNR